MLVLLFLSSIFSSPASAPPTQPIPITGGRCRGYRTSYTHATPRATKGRGRCRRKQKNYTIMFHVSTLWLRGQYKTRLKKRMVGFIPKVIPRKIKNNMVALRSEANTGHIEGYLKTEVERLDATGRKVQKVLWDPVLQRHCLFRETKIKGPFMTKAAIARKIAFPIDTKDKASK